MSIERRQRVVLGARLALGAVLLAPVLQTVLGALFSVYLGPRLEAAGHRIAVEEAHAIAAGLTVLSGATAVLIAWIVFTRMTRAG